MIHRERLSNERPHVAMAQSSEADNSNQSATVSNEIAQSNLGINGNSQVILDTALVSLEKPGCHEQIKCRAFLDLGAQLSCIRTMRTNLGAGEREVFDANIRHRCVGEHTLKIQGQFQSS